MKENIDTKRIAGYPATVGNTASPTLNEQAVGGGFKMKIIKETSCPYKRSYWVSEKNFQILREFLSNNPDASNMEIYEETGIEIPASGMCNLTLHDDCMIFGDRGVSRGGTLEYCNTYVHRAAQE
jgi:hypothetical protein